MNEKSKVKTFEELLEERLDNPISISRDIFFLFLSYHLLFVFLTFSKLGSV